MELLQRLPLELEQKIYLYLEHPIAELFKKTISVPPRNMSYVLMKLMVMYPVFMKSMTAHIFCHRKQDIFVNIAKYDFVANLPQSG